MDKLKPLIVHRFWVLLGLALMLPIIGWWMLSGHLQESIDARLSKLDTVRKNSQTGGDAPNPTWTVALSGINDGHDEKYFAAADRLYEDQKRLMQWPAAMHSKKRQFYSPDGVHFTDLPYRTPVDDPLPKYAYMGIYPDLWEQVVMELDPFHEGRGTIKVTPATIHRPPMPKAQTGDVASWPQIFSAQEDLWLLSSLFQSVRNVNASSKRITDATVRELVSLRLVGGTREGAADEELNPPGGGGDSGGSYGDASSYSGGSDYGGGADYGTDYGDYGSEDDGGDYGGDYGAGGGGSRSGPGAGSFDFSVAEEFGSSALPSGGSALAGGGKGEKRYVDCDPAAPYKTRGFHMKVVLLQESVPGFIAELSSSKFPVEVVRIHQEELNEDQAGAMSGGGGYGASGDYGGDDYGGDEEGDYGGDDGGYGGGDSYGGDSYGGGPATFEGSEKFLALSPKDQKTVASAMLDRDLVTLNIAGLIRMFRSQAERTSVASGEQSPDVAAEAEQEGDATPAPTAEEVEEVVGVAEDAEATDAGSDTLDVDAETSGEGSTEDLDSPAEEDVPADGIEETVPAAS